jgi:hypothetical protein
MRPNINLVICCIALMVASIVFYFTVASVNATILQAANIAGDKMSPKLQPTQHSMTVDGTMVIGNRKGGTFDVGVNMGKDNR